MADSLLIRCGMVRLPALLICICVCAPVLAGDLPEVAGDRPQLELPGILGGGPKSWTSPDGIGSSLQVVLLLAVLSLAPAALLMTTCFVRIVVVLSLLRQALGAQNMPPTQVITTLSLFLTLLIMTPVWKQVHNESIVPYTQHEIGVDEAMSALHHWGGEPLPIGGSRHDIQRATAAMILSRCTTSTTFS